MLLVSLRWVLLVLVVVGLLTGCPGGGDGSGGGY